MVGDEDSVGSNKTSSFLPIFFILSTTPANLPLLLLIGFDVEEPPAPVVFKSGIF